MAAKENGVLINGLSPVTSESEGTVVGFPDVCLTPGPNGPMPVPYTNVAKSEDLKDGSKTVTINGAPVCLSNSQLATSTGNEAGTAGGGVSSGKTKGPAFPLNYSFDVKIEGKPVVRNMDPFSLNGWNTAPFPIMQSQTSRPVAQRVEERDVLRPVERCPYCKKEKHPFDTKGRVGGNLGSSATLGRNMLEGRELSSHPWYAGPFSLAAHHLICLEALESEFWARICVLLGYHPDRKQNGVFLPMKMARACELHVAVHRGNHAEGYAFDIHLPYPRAVMKKLQEVEGLLKRGAFCADPDALVRKLDKISAEVLEKVARFLWTLTRDGLDYAPGGRGCSGLRSIRQKPSPIPCPQERRHTRERPLAKRSLRVGE
ncbi:DUF4150 domain-containing protein [Pyxidicoccus parkwayensis]|uniref:DUF4150 domain-containing protein n=1 Tax=Pyxidicoccus parkwayensis TaxID=2813578 RepID=A0ABX7NTG5_9BACT|nr:PAAR-like domain-containing protein [Pyxidicoccus parkwaysis]QSQ22167.1 DUF4150 domain-containing protein [Pyxidicoccus parkwaysis]